MNPEWYKSPKKVCFLLALCVGSSLWGFVCFLATPGITVTDGCFLFKIIGWIASILLVSFPFTLLAIDNYSKKGKLFELKDFMVTIVIGLFFTTMCLFPLYFLLLLFRIRSFLGIPF